MYNSFAADASVPWDAGFFNPQPSQDSELLQVLGFIPGLKELLALRQVHALEHATVWVLSEQMQRDKSQPSGDRDSDRGDRPDNDTLGGLSTERGFYLYGDVRRLDLQRAVRQALHRCQRGEWRLAIHPRCGTNASVNLVLTAGLALGAHLVLPRGPIEQLMGLGLATATAAQMAPEIGLSVQKYLTTAIPFNLEVTDIRNARDLWNRPAQFVEVGWRDLQ